MTPNILIVDDDDALRLSLTKLLGAAGYTVDSRRSAKTALAAMNLKVKEWDIVVSDLRLPEMDGLEFLRQVKALQAHVQVVLMTGYASAELEETALQMGAVALLRKPFPIQDLCQILESLAVKK